MTALEVPKKTGPKADPAAVFYERERGGGGEGVLEQQRWRAAKMTKGEGKRERERQKKVRSVKQILYARPRLLHTVQRWGYSSKVQQLDGDRLPRLSRTDGEKKQDTEDERGAR